MGTPKRILVVDDSEELRDLYQMLFVAEGYDVQTAEDGDRGFARARAWRPDVVILDVVMPGMDGLELLRKLRSDLAPPVPPVILCSGFDLSEDEAHRRGAVRFLRKPADPEDLVAAVSETLRGKRAPAATMRRQRARSSAARERVRETARELVRRIEAFGKAGMQLFEELAHIKLETLSAYVGIERGAFALVREERLAVIAATKQSRLEPGFDLGAAMPHAYEVLETGSSLLVPDAIVSPFPSVSRSLGGIRFFCGVPLRVGGVSVGVICLFDPTPHAIDADELTLLEIFGRRGSDVLLRFSQTGDLARLVQRGRSIVLREVFDDLLDAELRLLDRRGGSMELAVVDVPSVDGVEAALGRASSETRLVACLLSSERVAVFKRASDDSAGRQLAAVVKALRARDKKRAVGYVDLLGPGLRGLGARDLLHVACLALDRATERGDAQRRVVIEERPA